MNKVRLELKLNSLHSKGITGKNIGIAVLDTGIYPHQDFCKPYNRIVEFIDYVNGSSLPYDDNGHGTHVCGIIGGNGYSLDGMYTGVAPRCNIIALKVLDKYGVGSVENVIKALKWIIKYKNIYNIRIVNMSVGTYGNGKSDVKALERWVEKAWDSGLVVLTAAGNKGPAPMSITSPGTSKKIITVGISEQFMFIKNQKRAIRYYSGCGPTYECIVKPEVVAPGVDIISCSNKKNVYQMKSGTSMATPIVTGGIALVLDKCEINRRITNKEIKIGLLETSSDIGADRNVQGWGMINVTKMMEFLRT